MPMAMIHKVGPGDLYSVHFLDRTDPGFGHGPGQGTDPGWGQGHPGHRPDQGLPGGGHISNRPPGSGPGGIPDNELPDTPPPHLMPGYTLVMVRGPAGKWEYAAIDPGQAPPKPLPPGQPGHPSGQPIVPPGANYPSGQPVPPTAGQPLPPTAQPKR